MANTPHRRASETKKQVTRVRRKYKVDVNKRRKLLPGEIEHVEDMAIVLALAGYSRTQTGQMIGISRGQVREILERPHVSEKLIALRARLPQAALELLHGLMIEAVVAIADVMRTTKNEKYILEAASDILDRGGLPKASRQERHTVNEDKTTISDEGLLEKLRSAPVEVQEKAAELIEGLEELLKTEAEADAKEQAEDNEQTD